jgi:hypothetical protein
VASFGATDESKLFVSPGSDPLNQFALQAWGNGE